MGRQRIFLIIAAAMTLLFVSAGALLLHGQEEYVPPNQVSGLDAARSQVFLTGDGYQLDRQQEKNHQKIEKEREKKIKENPEKVMKRVLRAGSPTASAKKVRSDQGKRKSDRGTQARTPSRPASQEPSRKPSKPDRPTEKTPTSTQSEEERAVKPVIRISIADGEEVRGKRLDFTVTVKDYKGRNVPVFSEDDGSFQVVCNGMDLYSTGVNGDKTAFRTDLLEGENQITVIASDREGHEERETVHFIGLTSEQAEVTGQVYVCIQAPVLNLGVIFDAYIEITSGDTAKDVLEQAFDQAGITPTFSGGYLAGISRSGIAEGAWVSDDIRAELEERSKTEKDPDKQDRNRLKEHDFYDSSGWIYCVNGEFPERNVGSYPMANRDELFLIFQLDKDIY